MEDFKQPLIKISSTCRFAIVLRKSPYLAKRSQGSKQIKGPCLSTLRQFSRIQKQKLKKNLNDYLNNLEMFENLFVY